MDDAAFERLIAKRHRYKIGFGEAVCEACGKRVVSAGASMYALFDKEECPKALPLEEGLAAHEGVQERAEDGPAPVVGLRNGQ